MSRKPLTKTRKPQQKRSREILETLPQKRVHPAHPAFMKRWPWLVIVGIVLLLLLGLALRSLLSNNVPPPSPSTQASNATTSSTPGSTDNEQPGWKTLHTFNGGMTHDAIQKTQTFTVTGNWRMSWNCKGVHGIDDWLYITIYKGDGSFYNAGAQITCVDGKQVTGNAEEPQGGTYYLAINASTDWTVTIDIPQ